ncbi:sporulation protein Cse60 [Bacillus sp. CGMCC 1.16541]|uniref:sporulation protein Cse60 n=1 Tax=Bacillus sp. CGMCC 1.16541 TaxID=2185143 RepID=UPI000D727154|nr:sporulation protein Cse60 [Bacillus sp. CGMCC 1.16541]
MVQVKLFDKEHEKDLEVSVNRFLKTLSGDQIIDIKYQISTGFDREEQVYCFSAMVIYRD